MNPESMLSLDSAYALVNRAGEHIEELKGLHDEIVSAQAKATILNDVAHAPILHGQSAVVAEGEILAHAPIPDKFRILIGEATNSLRSALNYLVGRLSALDSGIKGRNTQFPIETDPKRFEGQRANYLEGVNDAHFAAIERLQPYNRCEWATHLQRLSNLHKHDDLVLVEHRYNLHYTIAPAEWNPGELAMSMKLEPTIRIAIGDGLPIIETLEILKSQITQTLDAFKPEF